MINSVLFMERVNKNSNPEGCWPWKGKAHINRATIEASQRLQAAGIVIETERYYRIWTAAGGTQCHELTPYNKNRHDVKGAVTYIPAPCMEEVWRELPGKFRTKEKGLYELQMNKNEKFTHAFYVDYETGIYRPCNGKGSANPTDALIYLLIHIRKDAK
jgi:hypothetical protein